MKKSLFLFGLLTSSALFAQECSDSFQATYKVINDSKEQTINVWRKNNSVAYQNQNSQVTDLWTASAKQRVKLVRLFEQHDRGIEYEAKEYSGRYSWQNLFHRFNPAQLATMKLVGSKGMGCSLTETYEFTGKNKKVEVKWQPKRQLASSVKIKSGDHQLIWKLTELNEDNKRIAKQFAAWGDYYLTDYVDIGDNESDPFLSKMINMGFVQGGASGFYDSQGNQLSGHGHHH